MVKIELLCHPFVCKVISLKNVVNQNEMYLSLAILVIDSLILHRIHSVFSSKARYQLKAYNSLFSIIKQGHRAIKPLACQNLLTPSTREAVERMAECCGWAQPNF